MVVFLYKDFLLPQVCQGIWVDMNDLDPCLFDTSYEVGRKISVTDNDEWGVDVTDLL